MSGIAAVVLAGCTASPRVTDTAVLPEVVDYNFHIRPILSDRCFKCHGPDEAALQGNLRLDLAEHATARIGDSRRRAIVPGKPGRSVLLDRLHSDDPEQVMPPPEAKLSVSDYEIAPAREVD